MAFFGIIIRKKEVIYMSLTAGIVGLPNVGKSTLFNAITKKSILMANYPFATIDPNVGVVIVPDERIDVLKNMYNPERVIPTTYEFTDIAGLVKGASNGEGLGNKFLSHIREVDAVVEVVRCFDDENIIHVDGSVDPIRDIEVINVELVLSDLEIVTSRINRIGKKAMTTKNKDDVKEIELLERIKEALESNIPVRKLGLDEEEKKLISSFNLITLKPIIYALNVEDNDINTGNNYTKLVDIIQDIGLMGKVSFTAEVEPIKINGKIIKHASLGSEDKAKALNLAKGDTVNIKYEIVPYLCIDEYCEENRSGNKPIKIVDKCPYCGKELTRNPELGCYDNPDCPAKVQGKIYTFCTRMGLTDIGESMIETLYHHGILNSIKDLFYLNEKIEEILQIDGFGKKILKNLISQISKLKVTESQVLSSVAIKGIGPKTAKNIISIYNINELYNIDINSLMEIPGISNNKATIIKKGVNDNKELLEFILTHVKIVKASKKSKPDGTVVFTGFRNPKLEKFLLEHFNLEVRDSLTKGVTIVLALDTNAKSSKLEKARKYNIPIYDLHEACEKFGYIE